ncbi:Gfo/Idh/MocA family protein [Aquimarina hainanensis]|uniref:Gfo/Idh/MocA family protein n=1 Tax=Aquimarina hainanensis TaxID=1578017 RepID=A0ABW5NDF2_9FLAO
MDKTIHWGILGCGSIARKFAQDLQTVPNAQLTAVASRSTENAQNFANQYNARTYYTSYETLCKDDNIDIIYIATPHVFHHEQTLLCLHHKKAVLCEKPFAMNKEQVQEMITLAQKNKLFLMEALWTYFLPHYQELLSIINNKELGAIRSLTADFGYYSTFDPDSRVYNKALGGGSLLDIGIYPLFAALSMIGYPDDIQASANMTSTGVDENCHIKLQYKSGVSASLYSTITKKTKTEAILVFEEGTIHIHSQFHKPTSFTIEKNGKKETRKFPVTTFGYNFEAAHAQEMLLAEKTESPIMSFDKSLQLIQLLDQVRQQINLIY